MFMVLDSFRVSWEAVFLDPNTTLPAGSLKVTNDLSIPNDVSKLVQTLLSNGYEEITVEKIYAGQPATGTP